MTRSCQCTIQRKCVVPKTLREVWESTRGLFTLESMRGLARRSKLPPSLDGLLNGLLYTSGRMGSNQSKIRSLRCTKRTPSPAPTQAPPSFASTQAPPSPAPTQASPSLAPIQTFPSLAPTQVPPSQVPTQTPPRQAQSRRIPDLVFRVLIIGRANAGKTSILQRVCDTTESPKIYRRGEEVRSTNFV